MLRLELKRIERGWSQQDLARRLHVNQTLVSAYERGIKLPSLDRLVRLQRIFDVEPMSLFQKVRGAKPTPVTVLPARPQ
jgi:transcriptional regulator with XRE-family HTH domain